MRGPSQFGPSQFVVNFLSSRIELKSGIGTSLNFAWLSGNQIPPGWPQSFLWLLALHPDNPFGFYPLCGSFHPGRQKDVQKQAQILLGICRICPCSLGVMVEQPTSLWTASSTFQTASTRRNKELKAHGTWRCPRDCPSRKDLKQLPSTHCCFLVSLFALAVGPEAVLQLESLLWEMIDPNCNKGSSVGMFLEMPAFGVLPSQRDHTAKDENSYFRVATQHLRDEPP